MKVIVNKALLGEAVNLLSKVIEKKCVLPDYGYILCEVSVKKMQLTASNPEVSITTIIDIVERDVDGIFCLPANDLAASLNNLSDQPLIIILSNNVTIIHADGEFEFPMYEADTYPLRNKEDFGDPIILSSDNILSCLKRSLFAMGSDDLRPVMNGICFKHINKYIDIVASDGHCLIKNSVYIGEKHYPLPDEIIIPSRVAIMLSKILQADDNIYVRANMHTCEMQFATTTVTFGMVEGKYPRYDSVIPQDFLMNVSLSRRILAKAIERVMPFANNTTTLVFAFGNNSLKISGENIDFVKSAFTNHTILWPYGDFVIGISGVRLSVMLQHIDADEIEFGINDPSTAIVIKQKTDDKPDDVAAITMMIMPMLINNE